LRSGKKYFSRFSAFAFILFVINYVLANWLGTGAGKVSLMVAFLWVVFLSFSYFYGKIRNRTGAGFLIGFLLLMGLKFIVALAGAFILIDPESDLVKQEALFYLFDYFILLIFDVALKVRELNNEA